MKKYDLTGREKKLLDAGVTLMSAQLCVAMAQSMKETGSTSEQTLAILDYMLAGVRREVAAHLGVEETAS